MVKINASKEQARTEEYNKNAFAMRMLINCFESIYFHVIFSQVLQKREQQIFNVNFI
jgi:hypothetical protein